MGNFAFSVSAHCLGRCRNNSWYLERISDIERSFRPNRNRSSHFPAWFFYHQLILISGGDLRNRSEGVSSDPETRGRTTSGDPSSRQVRETLSPETGIRATWPRPARWAKNAWSFHFFVTNASCHLQLRFFLYKRHNDLMPTTTSLKSHSHSHIFNVSRYIYAIERWVTCTCLKKAIFLSLSS